MRKSELRRNERDVRDNRRDASYDPRDYEPDFLSEEDFPDSFEYYEEPMEEQYAEEPEPEYEPVTPSGGKRKRRSRNKIYARITYLTVALFLCLMAYIVYFNIVRAPEIINSPYNPRAGVYAERVIKGNILSDSGDILAQTVATEDGSVVREYPYGSMFAHVVGYDTNGKGGLESVENTTLYTSNDFILERIVNDISDTKNYGDSIVTTLDTRLQAAAYEAMGDHYGAVVAIEPSTGKIKAMVSKPDFDPNWLSETWDDLSTDEYSSPLLNRATQGMYPPGSTFKILTTLEFMREDAAYNEFYYDCTGSITEGETTISCFDGTVHGEEDLALSFAYSCNSAFAQIGMNLDAAAFRQTADSLLFNTSLPCELYTAKPSFTLDGTAGYATKMMTAMGQGETLTNPYHMALIVSAIANGGTLMKPYLVDHVINQGGTTVRTTHPKVYETLMTTEESAVLTELMCGVTEFGTGYEFSYEDYSVAGKTGTAEYSDDKSKSHSWFVGFSNVDNPDLVVAVIMEGYDGNDEARSIPIAKSIFDAYYYE